MLEGGDTVYSYVAIRADEEYREGYSSKHDSLIVRLPLKEAGIDKAESWTSWRAQVWACRSIMSGEPDPVAPSASSSRRSSGCG